MLEVLSMLVAVKPVKNSGIIMRCKVKGFSCKKKTFGNTCHPIVFLQHIKKFFILRTG